MKVFLTQLIIVGLLWLNTGPEDEQNVNMYRWQRHSCDSQQQYDQENIVRQDINNITEQPLRVNAHHSAACINNL